MGLDIVDFLVEKGGDPKKIKESQRRRYASEEVVDEVIALYEDHRKSKAMPHNCRMSAVANVACSPILSDANQYKDQRSKQTNRNKAKGQGECR